ncbi:hypothetical protein DFR68_101193 [Nocardia mexicana]|uniref:Uncharacterized protein n=2 Tax=Nocardia mexicana TaxID=279262 RepID=A0A370HF85_9NOCA|nr:hypothetical protein DFR68_101193 [Nocardia mexicana]
MLKTNRLLAGFAIAAAAVGSTVATATTASAERVEGTSGCITYSYDDGNVSTTVYYHNVCNHGATVIVESTCTENRIDLGVDEHGHYVLDVCDVKSIRGSA